MVDKIKKSLKKLSDKNRKQVKIILQDLKAGRLSNYDIKKLKGRGDVYKIRKGKIRIIYRVDGQGKNQLLTIDRRDDNTYNL